MRYYRTNIATQGVKLKVPAEVRVNTPVGLPVFVELAAVTVIVYAGAAVLVAGLVVVRALVA